MQHNQPYIQGKKWFGLYLLFAVRTNKFVGLSPIIDWKERKKVFNFKKNEKIGPCCWVGTIKVGLEMNPKLNDFYKMRFVWMQRNI